MPARRKLATSRSSWLAIQNLWLQGEARPIELSTLVANGTVDQAAYKALPPAPSGDVTFPTQSQQATAENIVAQPAGVRSLRALLRALLKPGLLSS